MMACCGACPVHCPPTPALRVRLTRMEDLNYPKPHKLPEGVSEDIYEVCTQAYPQSPSPPAAPPSPVFDSAAAAVPAIPPAPIVSEEEVTPNDLPYYDCTQAVLDDLTSVPEPPIPERPTKKKESLLDFDLPDRETVARVVDEIRRNLEKREEREPKERDVGESSDDSDETVCDSPPLYAKSLSDAKLRLLEAHMPAMYHVEKYKAKLSLRNAPRPSPSNPERDRPSPSKRKKPNSPPPSRRPRRTATGRISLSGLSSTQTEEAKNIIKSLGGKVVDKDSAFLVTETVKRTAKFVTALSEGKPVVGLSFLRESSKRAKFLDPLEHLIVDREGEKKYGFSLRDTISNYSRFLIGYDVYCSPSIDMEPPILKKIVANLGGKFIWIRKNAVKITAPAENRKVLIVSCEKDDRLLKKLHLTNRRKYDLGSFLNSVLRGRLQD